MARQALPNSVENPKGEKNSFLKLQDIPAAFSWYYIRRVLLHEIGYMLHSTSLNSIGIPSERMKVPGAKLEQIINHFQHEKCLQM